MTNVHTRQATGLNVGYDVGADLESRVKRVWSRVGIPEGTVVHFLHEGGVPEEEYHLPSSPHPHHPHHTCLFCSHVSPIEISSCAGISYGIVWCWCFC